jgi:hypothetical protein
MLNINIDHARSKIQALLTRLVDASLSFKLNSSYTDAKNENGLIGGGGG